MKRALLAVLLGSASLFGQAAEPDAHYHLGPDSLVEEGVPKGAIQGPFHLPSEAYPGTTHTYWIYVPAQYDAGKPASLMIFQDGHAFLDPDGNLRAPNVLNNLIYRHELPVMIALFIDPGRSADQPEATAKEWGDKTMNRPTEYNVLDDRYAKVVVDELLPVVYKQYNIAKDADHHGIGGESSGGIAAFTVAWQRPDQFSKVLSIVGSFTNIRGGDAYPDMIASNPKKPLRIYLQDGRNDNRGTRPDKPYDQSRDWFYQNVRMQKALAAKGYDLNYSWGISKHGGAMGGAILPDMMRWLWRDHDVDPDPNNKVERDYAGAATAK